VVGAPEERASALRLPEDETTGLAIPRLGQRPGRQQDLRVRGLQEAQAVRDRPGRRAAGEAVAGGLQVSAPPARESSLKLWALRIRS
jgi:hypothetical protein